jgi:hypothetical protein
VCGFDNLKNYDNNQYKGIKTSKYNKDTRQTNTEDEHIRVKQ